jgi:hypothetical protein
MISKKAVLFIYNSVSLVVGNASEENDKATIVADMKNDIGGVSMEVDGNSGTADTATTRMVVETTTTSTTTTQLMHHILVT